MITLNRSKDFITGSVNGEQFGINFNQELFDKLTFIEEQLDKEDTIEGIKKLTESFKALLVEDSTTKNKSDIEGLYKGLDGNYYAEVGSIVTDIPVPEALVDRMRDSMDKGIDIKPLFKFWFRFLRNEKFRNLWLYSGKDSATEFSNKFFNYVNLDYTNNDLVEKLMEEKGYTEEVAIQLATTKQCKITKEGLLATFKVSKEITKKWILNDKGEKEQVDMYPVTKEIDPITGLVTYGQPDKGFNEDRWFQPAVMGTGGEEFYCADKLGHVIKVGQVHKLKDVWNSINSDDRQSCVAGLHCGGLSYIKGYQTKDTETHNTLVDPAHVGAVPDDNTGAIRVIQYFTLDAFSGINKSIYHSSSYAKITDEQFDLMKSEIAKEYSEAKSKQQKDLDLLNNL
jgi:hypothetical protein